MIIDSLTSFLTLHNEKIADVVLLYLPYANITDEDIDRLAAQIQKATHLTAINLRHSSLSAAAITKIIAAIEARPADAKPLESLNLYGNPELTTELNNRLSNKSTIIIAENSSNLPEPFTLPSEWALHEPYYEIEFQQIFDTVAQKLKEDPNIEKFHSARYPIFTPTGRKRKSNTKIESASDRQSRFPFSVVIMEDRTPMIIPTYQKSPEKLQRPKPKKDAAMLLDKGVRRKLGIRRGREGLIVDWGTIVLGFKDSIFDSENESRFRTRQPILFRTRACGYDGYISTKTGVVSAASLFKLYHFSKLEGDEDVLDFARRIDDGIEGLNFNVDKKLLVAAMLLETICFHNFGMLHLDIKPENFMVKGSAGLAKLVDLEHAAPMIPIQEMKGVITFGTPVYLPPEVKDAQCSILPTIDYFTCGASLLDLIFSLRQMETIPEAILRAARLPPTEITEELSHIIPLIQGLCDPDPAKRSSIQYAFQQLILIMPDICQEVVNLKLQAIKASLLVETSKYPSVAGFVQDMLVNLPNDIDLVARINLILKLQMACYYLNFLDLAGTEPEQVTQFTTAMEKLMASENKPLLACKDKYHYDATVDNKINELHNRAKAVQQIKRARHELS